jgi:thiol-disulfide isomerase/thioredoxin
VLFALAACSDGGEVERGEAKANAPDFDLPLLDGLSIRLAEMRGKIVILDFWATWCAPCEVQMPVLDTLWRDREWRAKNRDDLMIVGVSVDTDSPTKVADWIAERGFEYPIAIGDHDLAMRYGVIGYPTLVFIDPAGGIHTRHIGVWSRPEIELALDQIRLDSAGGG